MNDRVRPPDLQALIDGLRATGAGSVDSDIRVLVGKVVLLARSRLKDGDRLRRALDSEDLAQEAIVDLVANVHLFEGRSWPEFRAFVDAVLQRRKVDLARHLRARKRSAGLDAEPFGDDGTAEPGPGPASVLVHRESSERARDLVEELPLDLREPLKARLAGRGFSDIARSLGLTEVTVRKRVSRAIAELRRRWSRD